MNKFSGIGTYISNLMPIIIEKYAEVDFTLLADINSLQEMSWAKASNISLLDVSSPIYSITEQIELVNVIPRDTTLFWSPHYNIPLLYRGKLLVTIHDVFHLAMPQYVHGFHKRLYAKFMFSSVRRMSDAIIFNSDFTANEFIRLVGRPRGSFKTIHLGIDKEWFKLGESKCPHPRPYLLFIGNVKPHKNLVQLVKAFSLICDKIGHDLVIVGKKEGFIISDNEVEALASCLGERVRFTGYVDEVQLRQYYAFADALILPSLYEGFGLPPLEAMACGCPSITSQIASLPEVCGNATLYCDPYNVNDIADKICMLINDSKLRNELTQKGFEHVKQFTWERCANKTISVINGLLYKE